jgi:hypothetical protein
VWSPTARNPDRTVYHVVPVDGSGPAKVVGPWRRDTPVYWFDGQRIYRGEGHPDGPSAVPYLRFHLQYIQPDEGYPGGASDVVLYRARPVRRKESIGVRVHRLRRDKEG